MHAVLRDLSSEVLSLQKSIALPDMHSGYGFAIGNVAAFDMGDPEAVVSPGGVGFDINCGVRLIRTNLVMPPSKLKEPSVAMHACIVTSRQQDCSAVDLASLFGVMCGNRH